MPRMRLKPGDVRAILTDVFCNGFSRTKAARRHGVSKALVCLIVTGQCWKEIFDEFHQDEEPSMTQLERMIAQQMQRLPPWWWNEEDKLKDEQLPALPAVHARGRGVRALNKRELRCGMV